MNIQLPVWYKFSKDYRNTVLVFIERKEKNNLIEGIVSFLGEVSANLTIYSHIRKGDLITRIGFMMLAFVYKSTHWREAISVGNIMQMISYLP